MLDTIFEWLINALGNAFEWLVTATMNALGSGVSDLITQFPSFINAYYVFRAVGIGLVAVIGVLSLGSFFLGSVTRSHNTPYGIILRVLLAGVLVYTGGHAAAWVVDIAKAPYNAMLDVNAVNHYSILNGLASFGTNLVNGEDFAIVSVTTITNILTGSLTGTAARALLTLIILSIIAVNLVGLIIEVFERYIMVGVLLFSCPLAFSTLASADTEPIFKKWCSMFFSQCLLMTLSVWSLKLCLSGLAADVISDETTLIIRLILVLAMCKIAKRMDSYLGQLGLNAAHTGDDLLGEMIGVGRKVFSGGPSGGEGAAQTGGSKNAILGSPAMRTANNIVSAPVRVAQNVAAHGMTAEQRKAASDFDDTFHTVKKGVQEDIQSNAGQVFSPRKGNSPAEKDAAARASGISGSWMDMRNGSAASAEAMDAFRTAGSGFAASVLFDGPPISGNADNSEASGALMGAFMKQTGSAARNSTYTDLRSEEVGKGRVVSATETRTDGSRYDVAFATPGAYRSLSDSEKAGYRAFTASDGRELYAKSAVHMENAGENVADGTSVRSGAGFLRKENLEAARVQYHTAEDGTETIRGSNADIARYISQTSRKTFADSDTMRGRAEDVFTSTLQAGDRDLSAEVLLAGGITAAGSALPRTRDAALRKVSGAEESAVFGEIRNMRDSSGNKAVSFSSRAEDGTVRDYTVASQGYVDTLKRMDQAKGTSAAEGFAPAGYGTADGQEIYMKSGEHQAAEYGPENLRGRVGMISADPVASEDAAASIRQNYSQGQAADVLLNSTEELSPGHGAGGVSAGMARAFGAKIDPNSGNVYDDISMRAEEDGSRSAFLHGRDANGNGVNYELMNQQGFETLAREDSRVKASDYTQIRQGENTYYGQARRAGRPAETENSSSGFGIMSTGKAPQVGQENGFSSPVQTGNTVNSQSTWSAGAPRDIGKDTPNNGVMSTNSGVAVQGNKAADFGVMSTEITGTDANKASAAETRTVTAGAAIGAAAGAAVSTLSGRGEDTRAAAEKGASAGQKVQAAGELAAGVPGPAVQAESEKTVRKLADRFEANENFGTRSSQTRTAANGKAEHSIVPEDTLKAASGSIPSASGQSGTEFGIMSTKSNLPDGNKTVSTESKHAVASQNNDIMSTKKAGPEERPVSAGAVIGATAGADAGISSGTGGAARAAAENGVTAGQTIQTAGERTISSTNTDVQPRTKEAARTGTDHSAADGDTAVIKPENGSGGRNFGVMNESRTDHAPSVTVNASGAEKTQANMETPFVAERNTETKTGEKTERETERTAERTELSAQPGVNPGSVSTSSSKRERQEKRERWKNLRESAEKRFDMENTGPVRPVSGSEKVVRDREPSAGESRTESSEQQETEG